MDDIIRRSPVKFETRPVKTEVRDHWAVVRACENEGTGPWLVDLSHKPRWDLQDVRLDERKTWGIAIPPVPGASRLENRILVNRMNRTQASVWHLGSGGMAPEPTGESGYTDVSEATVFLGLLGPRVFAIAERLSILDFMDPARRTPFLFQAPFCHVPCQIVALVREKDESGMLLFTGSRGYSRDMVQAVLAAGAAFGLRPAGEDRFTSWLASKRL